MALNAVTLGRLFSPSALHTTGIERISDTDHINVRTGKKGKLSYDPTFRHFLYLCVSLGHCVLMPSFILPLLQKPHLTHLYKWGILAGCPIPSAFGRLTVACCSNDDFYQSAKTLVPEIEDWQPLTIWKDG